MVTSIAGHFVILRGNTFTVGDRISMGGVRGDVMRLGFNQTIGIASATYDVVGFPPIDLRRPKLTALVHLRPERGHWPVACRE